MAGDDERHESAFKAMSRRTFVSLSTSLVLSKSILSIDALRGEEEFVIFDGWIFKSTDVSVFDDR